MKNFHFRLVKSLEFLYFEIHRAPFANQPGQFSLSGQIFLHLTAATLKGLTAQRRKTETKPDIYSKDRIFVTSFAFCVITYEPIEVQTFSAPQNDRQNLGFVKDIKVVVEKMTRNRRKVIGKPGDSLLCRLHSIQLSSLVYSFLYD